MGFCFSVCMMLRLPVDSSTEPWARLDDLVYCYSYHYYYYYYCYYYYWLGFSDILLMA